jgi:hypothetical protein
LNPVKMLLYEPVLIQTKSHPAPVQDLTETIQPACFLSGTLTGTRYGFYVQYVREAVSFEDVVCRALVEHCCSGKPCDISK